MISDIIHVGVTVSDMERSIAFYRDTLGLELVGRMVMEGDGTDRLFGRKGCRAEVAYLRRGRTDSPPVELIQFTSDDVEMSQTDLFRTSISEICFATDDIQSDYERMKALGVEFLSEPQPFDSTEYGLGRSVAVYFRDPDGTILELLQTV